MDLVCLESRYDTKFSKVAESCRKLEGVQLKDRKVVLSSSVFVHSCR